jgi:5-oxoprolinase (ATP-hydrolysing)
MRKGFKFSIDRGGTFTDVVAITPDNNFKTTKLLSEDPANYNDAPTEGKKLFLIPGC